MRARFEFLSILALMGFLLAGCGGSSSLPGLGVSDGVNTNGTGISNPDATLYFRFNEDKEPDFIATDMTARQTIIGTQIQGVQTTGLVGRQTQRSATFLFNDPPVKKIYNLDANATDGVTFQYTERAIGASTIAVWQAVSGTITVVKVDGSHVDATFKGRLEPVANTTLTFDISRGLLRARIR